MNRCRDQRQTDESEIELSAAVGADGMVEGKVAIVRFGLCGGRCTTSARTGVPMDRAWATKKSE